MEAPWLSGFSSSCPHAGPPSHIANLQQTSIQTPSCFTTQPQQPTNKPVTQLSAHNLMSCPPLSLKRPISWQEVIRHFTTWWDRTRVSAVKTCCLNHHVTVSYVCRISFFVSSFYKNPGLPWIHRLSQPLCKTFFAAPSSLGIKSNQSIHMIPTTSSSPSFFLSTPGHPIPTLFPDPSVTI